MRAQARRLHAQVIKVGTSSLVRPEQNTLNLSSLARLCEVRGAPSVHAFPCMHPALAGRNSLRSPSAAHGSLL